MQLIWLFATDPAAEPATQVLLFREFFEIVKSKESSDEPQNAA